MLSITIIVSLAFVFCLLFILSFIFPTKNKIDNNQISQPSPLPTYTNTTPTMVPTIPVASITPPDKQQLINLMPISTAQYDIEYLSAIDTFLVTIKFSPYESNKNLAINWFHEHGISDTSSLNIVYRKYSSVQ